MLVLIGGQIGVTRLEDSERVNGGLEGVGVVGSKNGLSLSSDDQMAGSPKGTRGRDH